MKRFFALLLLSLLGAVWLHASISDYLQLYQKRQEAYYRQMKSDLQRAMGEKRNADLAGIYRRIGYRPVWVDSDGLTHNGELLLYEVGEDLKEGLYRHLKDYYDDIVTAEDELAKDSSEAKRLETELDVMRLYLDYIHSVGRNRGISLDPVTLLTAAMQRSAGDLSELFNRISKERIADRTAYFSKRREEFLKSGAELKGSLARKLRFGSDQDRQYRLYKAVGFQPIWVTKTGISPYTKELYEQIGQDPLLEKNGSVRRVYRWLKQASLPDNDEDLAIRELEINWLYQHYMNERLYGSIDWKAFRKAMKRQTKHGAWIVHEVLLSPEMLLIDALNRGSLRYAFVRSAPRFPVYRDTVRAYDRYRRFAEAGGWPRLPDSAKGLKHGMRSPDVALLRKRLAIEGDWKPCRHGDANLSSIRYDACLERAVKAFQKRHGLESDGIIGQHSLRALNESAEQKAARLRLNLDRLKWLKRDSERYHVVANIPDFRVTVFEGNTTIQSMRIVTGRRGHETPIFYNRMRRVVLNPYWRIPPSIVRHETIPKLRKSPGYAARSRIEIHKGWSQNSPRIDPYAVNWSRYGKKLPPWHFMQSPGPKNALGKVKFLFPNPFSVYMHDTPEKALFAREIRAFSHGCVRLHRPIDMLQTIAEIDPGSIDFNRATSILESNRNTPLRLSKTIPVDIIYLSAWGDANGTVQFREDIYGYDALQLQTMKRRKAR